MPPDRRTRGTEKIFTGEGVCLQNCAAYYTKALFWWFTSVPSNLFTHRVAESRCSVNTATQRPPSPVIPASPLKLPLDGSVLLRFRATLGLLPGRAAHASTVRQQRNLPKRRTRKRSTVGLESNHHWHPDCKKRKSCGLNVIPRELPFVLVGPIATDAGSAQLIFGERRGRSGRRSRAVRHNGLALGGGRVCPPAAVLQERKGRGAKDGGGSNKEVQGLLRQNVTKSPCVRGLFPRIFHAKTTTLFFVDIHYYSDLLANVYAFFVPLRLHVV